MDYLLHLGWIFCLHFRHHHSNRVRMLLKDGGRRNIKKSITVNNTLCNSHANNISQSYNEIKVTSRLNAKS